MWIFSRRGFYSVVEHKDNPNLILVRARREQDLVNLVQKYELPYQITEHPDYDYRWRLVIDRLTWRELAFELMVEIDYPNFKSKLAQTDQLDKLPMLLGFWEELVDYQKEHHLEKTERS
jgi:hypothetical protein